MSTSAEAVKAAQVLNHKTFHGSRLFVNISHKYTRLVNGYDVQSDSDMEKSESRSSRRRDRISKSRTSDRDEARRKSESRRESGPRKTPERESGPRKTPERESGPSKTPERESGPRKTPERESGPRKTPERELLPKMGPEDKMLKGNVGSENKSFPDKKQKSQNEKEATEKDAAEKEPAMIPEDASETSPDQPQTEQKSPDSGDAVKLEQPVGGIAESEKPTKPVGTKFVRPVVGYFCHLCQVIYADEEEAKLQHCSSLTHYRKYQEKTGIDPWTS
nr:PREDICTED: neurofilament heavy polypeptide-like [Paralichthys olivaceus]